MDITVEIRTKSPSRYSEMREWCVEKFGKSGKYVDDRWNSRASFDIGYALFYFGSSKDASWFMLRWL